MDLLYKEMDLLYKEMDKRKRNRKIWTQATEHDIIILSLLAYYNMKKDRHLQEVLLLHLTICLSLSS